MAKYIYIKAMRDACPSLCHTCTKARKPCSEELAKEGWVGCASMFCDRSNPDEDPKVQLARILRGLKAARMGTGWVKPVALDNDEESGMMVSYNDVLLTMATTKCSFYDKKR